MKLNSIGVTRAMMLISCAAAGLLAHSAAIAHDIWVTVDKQGGELSALINNGDPGKQDLASEDRVVTLELLTPAEQSDLRRSLVPGQHHGQPVLKTRAFAVPERSLLSVSYDNGFWINAPETNAEINTSKLMVAKGTSAHWTVKFGKALLGPGSYERVVNARLELVPLKDPYTLAVGQLLPVRLNLSGKPLKGARIHYMDGVTLIADDKIPSVVTGDDGIVNVPLARKGAYLLRVDVDVPPMHPALAQNDHLYASLTFDTSK